MGKWQCTLDHCCVTSSSHSTSRLHIAISSGLHLQACQHSLVLTVHATSMTTVTYSRGLPCHLAQYLCLSMPLRCVSDSNACAHNEQEGQSNFAHGSVLRTIPLRKRDFVRIMHYNYPALKSNFDQWHNMMQRISTMYFECDQAKKIK